MKKILLIIFTIILILSVNVLAIDIDIGMPAINRGTTASTYTWVNIGNPANESGTITSIEIWAMDTLENCEVATFFVVSGNNLSTRDHELIGNVTKGSKQTFSVDLDVQAGDYIGAYYTCWMKTGDNIPCTNLTFSNRSGEAISLYGTGATLEPDPPTNVQASDGTYTDRVRITWTKSDGATGYQVYRDGVGLDWLGDVATYDDTGADAPTFTAGTASASDGTSTDHVTLSIAGESANDGTTHTYKVRAKNGGESGYSETDTGYRGHYLLTYQWQRSAADSDGDYSNIDGATTDPYNDTGAPENGDGRYYQCIVGGTVMTNADRGYRLAVGWDHKWNTQTISKWNTKEFTKWNGLE